MQVIKLTLFYFLILVLTASCGQKKLEPVDYVEWVKDYSNGLHAKKQVEDIVFDVQYKPSDFIIVSETKGKISDVSSYSKRFEEVSAMQYFTLSLSIAGNKVDFLKHGVSSENEFYNKQYYYSFSFQNDISLLDGEKILPCKIFHFERSYDLKNSRTFILGFPKSDNPSGDKTMLIDSKDINLGIVKIKFNKEDLTSIPQLKI